MSYTNSKATSGSQSVLAINTGTVSTPAWTTIGEVVSIALSGRQNNTDDTTNFESTAEEFIPTLLKPGSYKLEMNRVSTDAGQAALAASFYAVPPTLLLYKLTLPKESGQTSTGDVFQFTALVEELDDTGTLKPDKKIGMACTLKVSGAVTFTEGS